MVRVREYLVIKFNHVSSPRCIINKELSELSVRIYLFLSFNHE